MTLSRDKSCAAAMNLWLAMSVSLQVIGDGFRDSDAGGFSLDLSELHTLEDRVSRNRNATHRVRMRADVLS